MLRNYLYQQQKITHLPSVQKRIDAVIAHIESLQAHQISAVVLPPLEISVNFIVNHLLEYSDLFELSENLLDFRQFIIEEFGLWHVFNQLFVTDLANFLHNKHAVELMAGHGALSFALQQEGIEIVAVDNLNWDKQDAQFLDPWTTVIQDDALQFVMHHYHQTDVFILSWAPDTDDIDWQILQFLRQKQWPGTFLVIGETFGATNSPIFWKNAHLKKIEVLNQHHQPFDFINDQVFIVT